MPLFVDGYNLIFAASKRMQGFDISEPEAARDRLVELLAKYRSIRSDRVEVFFDGGADAAHLPRHAAQRGINIRFSDSQSDADTDIKLAVTRHDNPRSVRVISSDMAIQRFVKRYGAEVTDSETFLREVADALEDRSVPQDEPIEKYEDVPPDDIEYWLGVFGEELDDNDR